MKLNIKGGGPDGLAAAFEDLCESLPDAVVARQHELISAIHDRLSVRPEAACIPSGWLAVPVTPTIAMHNAAAFCGAYEQPRLAYREDGLITIQHAAPDWSQVWTAMVEAAPSVPSQPAKCAHKYADNKAGEPGICIYCGDDYWKSLRRDTSAPSPLRQIEPSPTCSSATGVCLSPRACDYEGKCRKEKP